MPITLESPSFFRRVNEANKGKETFDGFESRSLNFVGESLIVLESSYNSGGSAYSGYCGSNAYYLERGKMEAHLIDLKNGLTVEFDDIPAVNVNKHTQWDSSYEYDERTLCSIAAGTLSGKLRVSGDLFTEYDLSFRQEKNTTMMLKDLLKVIGQ